MIGDFRLIGDVVLNSEGFRNGLDNLQSQGEQFSRSFTNSMFGAMTAANLASKGVELLMSTLKSAVNEFTMLDTNLAKVNTLLDQQVLSTTNLRMELLRVSSATGIYASELANASYEALSAGVETQNLTEFIEGMTTLSQGGFTSVTQAVNVATSIMNAYGKEVYTAKEISDKLVKTQALGKTTVDELSRSLYNVIPAATSMGVGLDDVLASIAVLTASGTPTAQATTQVRQALLEMNDAGTKVGKSIQSLTGKSFKELIKEGYSVSDVIRTLSEESKKSGKSIDDLYSSAEAKGAVITLAKQGVEDYVKAIDGIKDSVGEAEKAQKIAIDNMSESWSKLAVQITNKFVSEGGAFTELNTHLIEFARNTVDILGYAGSLVSTFLVNTGKAVKEVVMLPETLLNKLTGKTQAVAPVGAVKEEEVKETPKTETPIIPVVGELETKTSTSSKDGKSAEQLANEVAREERRLFLEEQRNYNAQRDILDSEFKTSQLEKDIEFFNQISEMKNQNWVDEMDLDQAYQDYQYEKFQAEQEFRLEQLQADLEFYANKKEYAADYANTLASIKELEAQSIEKALDREEQLKNRDLTFAQRVNKSKESLIKGAYSTLLTTNGNTLKALGDFFTKSIANIAMQHGAELLYGGIKSIGKGNLDIAEGMAKNAKVPGTGVALMAAGADEIAKGKMAIAQSALFGAAGAAIGSLGGGEGGSGSGSDVGYSNAISDREESVSLEKEKTVTIYTDGDMKDVMLSMLGTLNDLAKDYNNIQIISK